MSTHHFGFTILIVSLIILSIFSVSAISIQQLQKKKLQIPAPSGLKAKALTDDKVSLAWKYSNGPYIFKIYRAESFNGTYERVGSTKKTKFTDRRLEADTTYYYKIQAVRKGKPVVESEFSKIVKVTTLNLSNPINTTNITNSTTTELCGLNEKEIEICLSETNATGEISATVLSSSTLEHYFITNVDNSLVGWWTFDNVEGSIVKDSSTYGNNGLLIDNTVITPGKFGNAVELKGSNPGPRIDVDDSSSLQLNGPVTISLWINISKDCILMNHPLVYSGSKTNYKPALYYLSLNMPDSLSEEFIFYRSNFEGDIVYKKIAIPYNSFVLGEWNHIVFTVDDSSQKNAKFYINGNYMGKITYSGVSQTAANNDFFIGHYPVYGTSMNGFLDEVMVFNRALSESEVKSLYDAKANPYANIFSSLSSGSHTIQGFVVNSDGTLLKTDVKTIVIG